jgi:surfeit locus 1 family protein
MPVPPVAEPVETQLVARPLWRTILTPRWTGLLVLALAIAAVMSVLGVWQLDVYRSKTAAATAGRAAVPPVALQSLFSIDSGLPAAAVARRVTVTGNWAPAADQLFISDRAHNDQDGFWVVTPLLLDKSSTSGSGGPDFMGGPGGTDGSGDSAGAGRPAGAVMVVRGWIASVDDPAARAPSGRVSLTGAVAASEAQDSSGDATKGRVLQSLRIPTIVHLVDYRIYDAFVVLTSVDQATSGTPSTGAVGAPALVSPPSPPTDHAGLRNVAYAFQWWLFAAFTLWMWARMVLDTHRSEADPDPESDPVAEPEPDSGPATQSAVEPTADAAADPGAEPSAEGDQAQEPVESSGTVSA